MSGPTIILPGEVTRKFRYRCHGCGKGFYEHEARAWQRHTIRCAEENEERMLREARGPLFGGLQVDAEYEAWVRDNARAIVERSKRM